MIGAVITGRLRIGVSDWSIPMEGILVSDTEGGTDEGGTDVSE